MCIRPMSPRATSKALVGEWSKVPRPTPPGGGGRLCGGDERGWLWVSWRWAARGAAARAPKCVGWGWRRETPAATGDEMERGGGVDEEARAPNQGPSSKVQWTEAKQTRPPGAGPSKGKQSGLELEEQPPMRGGGACPFSPRAPLLGWAHPLARTTEMKFVHLAFTLRIHARTPLSLSCPTIHGGLVTQ